MTNIEVQLDRLSVTRSVLFTPPPPHHHSRRLATHAQSAHYAHHTATAATCPSSAYTRYGGYRARSCSIGSTASTLVDSDRESVSPTEFQVSRVVDVGLAAAGRGGSEGQTRGQGHHLTHGPADSSTSAIIGEHDYDRCVFVCVLCYIM